MTKLSPLAFRVTFNGESLIADPTREESLHDGLIRALEKHSGSKVTKCGKCKRTNGKYGYSITLANGLRAVAVIEGNAEAEPAPADEPATLATWAQKIKAIKLAAEVMGKSDIRAVNRNLAEGVEHMEYKDFTEFDCSCEDEYIFGEAVHLIDELELPFDEALKAVLSADQPGTETISAINETKGVETETEVSNLALEQAKAEILSCLDNASHVIHHYPTESGFLSWWEAHGSGDLGLTELQFLGLYRQLRAEIYTFDTCLAEYRRLLQGRPQHALLIGDGQYAFLQPSGELIGLSVDKHSTVDHADVYDFDSSAFNTSIGGWMDESYVETRQRITDPVFVLVTATFSPAG